MSTSSGRFRFSPPAALSRVLRDDPRSCARPSLLDDFIKLLGADATRKLVSDFGGRRVYIPHAPEAGDQLSRSIGLDAAVRLARTYGGDRVVMPSDADRSRRSERILALRSRRMSVAAIARRLRCTERYVYKVLANSRRAHHP